MYRVGKGCKMGNLLEILMKRPFTTMGVIIGLLVTPVVRSVLWEIIQPTLENAQLDAPESGLLYLTSVLVTFGASPVAGGVIGLAIDER